MSDILVAAPTALVKDYCFTEYVAGVRALDEEVDLYIIDTTPDDAYEARLVEMAEKWRFNWKWIGWKLSPVSRINDLTYNVDRAWVEIVAYGRANGYRWLLSIESDIIVPSHTARMLKSIAAATDAVAVYHSYPQRGDPDFLMEAFGCTLFSLKGDDVFPDPLTMDIIRKNVYCENLVANWPKMHKHVVIRIDNMLDIRHIKEPI